MRATISRNDTALFNPGNTFTPGISFVGDTDTGLTPFAPLGLSLVTGPNVVPARWGSLGIAPGRDGVAGFPLDVAQGDEVLNASSVVARLSRSSTDAPTDGFGQSLALALESSTTEDRAAGILTVSWATAAEGAQKGRLTIAASDDAGDREGFRVETDGSAPLLGFYGATAAPRPAISGSKASNAALTSLVAALAALGLVTDGTS